LVTLHAPEHKGVSWPGSKFIQCSTSLASQPSRPASNACKEHSVELTVHCTTHAGLLGMPFHNSSSPFHSTECRHL